MKTTRSAARGKARRFVLQGLYQIKLTEYSASEVEQQLIQDHDMKRVDKVYLHELLSGISQQRQVITQTIAQQLDRPLDEVDPVELAALSVGSYELLFRPDIPYRVAINESIELAKQFGASESYKLVNSVLDGVARQVRTTEYQCQI